jgi:hypothetical protein
MKAERLEGEFAPRAVPHTGGLLLLRPQDALALVSRAAEEGVPILGVDGLRVHDTGTESPLERLADYASRVADGHGCWKEAEAFIRAQSDLALVFELTLGGDPVEAVQVRA